MTVERNVARVAVATLVALAGLVVGSTGVAMAAAPNLAIVDPVAASSTHEQKPQFSGTTDDALDPVTLRVYAGTDTTASPVQTLVDPTPLEVALAEATWSTTPESLEPGQYTAVAEQTNAESETGQSPAVTFTIDTTPPVVSFASVLSPSKDATPSFTGGAGTAVGDASTVAVEVYEGSSISGSPVRTVDGAVSGSTWTAGPVASLADGTYTAQASQSDQAGNVGTSTAVTFTIDTTPPVVSFASVLSPSKDATPSFTGGAGTAVGDASTVAVAVYEGGSVSGSLVRTVDGAVSGSTWTAGPVGSLADGTYTAQVSQSDAAGNTGASPAVTFTIDTTPPVVSVTAPAAGAVLNSSQPSISGQAGQASGDDPSVTLKLYAGSTVSGSPLQTHEVTPSGANWTTGAVAALADGTYTVRAEQSDTAGNTGTSAAVTFTIDTTLPAVTLTSPATGSSTTAAFEALSGAAGTSVRDLPQITVKLFAGSQVTSGVPLQEVTVPAVNGAWSAAFGGLSPGTYTARAQQSNNLDRTGFSEPVTFTVKTPVVPPSEPKPTPTTTTTTPPPSPPAASFQWFPAAPRVGEPVTLVSTSTDPTGPITGFAWSAAGNGVFTGGTSTFATLFSTPGSHVVVLRVTGASGIASRSPRRSP